ncbi:hypothetical protein CYMTET_37432 [Cymbomonas tetramitiformis]|uniref:BZIP domain-containing protein n=1 Tax=Cymbomonas tetramitiformis TaxID=36881 RepID=A0AAE0CDZ3_9CHLO|nr:hypothetical protein CYMTET_37432 [Cymbomonas tetramitiformis]
MEDLPNAPLPLKLPRTAIEQSTHDIRRSSCFMRGPGILAGAERLQPPDASSPMETLAERLLSGRLSGDLAAMETPEELPFNDKDLVELRSICWESLDQNSPPPEAVALIPPDEMTDDVRSSRASSATSAIMTEPGGTALAAAGTGLDPFANMAPALAGPAASLKWFAADDVSTPKTKRKMQNRAASARFRERARQRATELEICKEQTEKHQKENEMLKEELAAALVCARHSHFGGLSLSPSSCPAGPGHFIHPASLAELLTPSSSGCPPSALPLQLYLWSPTLDPPASSQCLSLAELL